MKRSDIKRPKPRAKRPKGKTGVFKGANGKTEVWSSGKIIGVQG